MSRVEEKKKLLSNDDKGDKSVNFEGFEWFVQRIRFKFLHFLKTWAAFANYYLALNFACLKTHY